MRISKPLLCYFMTLSVGMTAFACGEPAQGEDKNLYKFSFSFEGENMVLHREINSEAKEDLLDDTGYLGIKIGLASMVDGQEKTVRYERYKANIAFVKDRIGAYLKVIRPLTIPDAARMEVKEKVVQKLNKLKQIIDQNPSSNEVYELWNSIESLNSKIVTVTAKARKNQSSPWGDEESLKVFTLPAPKWHDASKPQVRCFSLPYATLDLNTYKPPRIPTRKSSPEQTSGARGISG